MPRKTIKIETLLAEVNRRNRESICQPKIRQGWNSLLETVLHNTGNYRGFGYLESNMVPAGQRPGIKMEGSLVSFDGCDETRRYYL